MAVHDSKSKARVALRQLPSVDELLRRPRLAALAQQAHRGLVVELAREVLDEMRVFLGRGGELPASELDAASIEERVAAHVAHTLSFSLRPVINATGVILHTNLGRAPLAPAAIEHLRDAATQYSNLEYDLVAGERGKRDVHTARLLARVCSAEAAIVVNNNAAAVLLVLNTLAKGGEVIVSRGELVEIGDGFRVPDIMAESGAILREVGTTNRTRIADYERAITERTRLLLRVHPSNFRIVGFTERPTLEELVTLGRRAGMPVFEDLGSGCLVDLAPCGFDEPLVKASLAGGASLVSFSGDKLLGGPQAGVVVGKRELVERVRRNALFRALRVDKLTISALEATLISILRNPDGAGLEQIPILRMIRLRAEEIGRRAEQFIANLRAALPASAAGEVEINIRDAESVLGGGSTPAQHLATRVITLASVRYSAVQLESRLRLGSGLVGRGFSRDIPASPQGALAPEGLNPPVIARIEDDRLVLDLRTVFPEQESALLAALVAALQ